MDQVSELIEQYYEQLTLMVGETIGANGGRRLECPQELGNSFWHIWLGSLAVNGGVCIVLRQAQHVNVWTSAVVQSDEQFTRAYSVSKSMYDE